VTAWESAGRLLAEFLEARHRWLSEVDGHLRAIIRRRYPGCRSGTSAGGCCGGLLMTSVCPSPLPIRLRNSGARSRPDASNGTHARDGHHCFPYVRMLGSETARQERRSVFSKSPIATAWVIALRAVVLLVFESRASIGRVATPCAPFQIGRDDAQ
jgi:hypothetical protein